MRKAECFFYLQEVNCMALFDYKCKGCGEVSEYLVFSDSEKLLCKKCGSENLEKQISGFAVSIKSPPSATFPPSCPNSGRCGGGMCGF